MGGKIKLTTQLIAFVLFVAFVIQFFRHIENGWSFVKLIIPG